MSRSKLVAIIMGLCVIGDSMLYITLPPSYLDLGLDNQITGLILSVNRFTRLAFNPLAAVVIARLGYKKTAVISSMMAIVCTFGYSVVSTPALWLALRAVWGLTWSLIRLTAMLVTIEEATVSTRGRALGSMQRLVRIGSVTGTLGGGILLDRIGFRPTAAVLGIVTISSLVLALLLKPDRAGRSSSPPAQVPEERSAPLPQEPGGGAAADTRSCLARGWQVYASTLLTALAVGGIFLSTSGVLLKSRMAGQTAVIILGFALGAGSLNGAVGSLRWLSDILFSPWMGRVSDKFGRRLPMTLIYTLQAASGLIIILYPGLLTTVIASGLLYAAQSLALVVLSSSAADLTLGTRASVSMTIYSSFLDLGEAMGPVVAYNLMGIGLMQSYSIGTGVVLLLAVTWAYSTIFRRREMLARVK